VSTVPRDDTGLEREDTDLLALAEHAARSAGQFLLRRPQHLEVESKSTPTDVVTQMDAAAERLLIDILLAARPNDSILGEEGGSRAGSSGVRWVIDPLDGTVNYLYDLPGWAVSVAAERDGVVVAGAVEIPSWGDSFSARRGAGAFCNGAAIQVSECADLRSALVGTGFAYDSGRRGEQAQAVAQMLPQVRDIRRFGAAAADLCAVACGRLDAYAERGLQPWDHAAGALIAAEAGAEVLVDGAPTLVCAAPVALMPAFTELIAEVGL